VIESNFRLIAKNDVNFSRLPDFSLHVEGAAAGGRKTAEVGLALPLRYHPSLDGMRAVAVMLVAATHCHVPGLNPGYFGVDLFFVLSGFLITWLLLEEIDATRKVDLKRFFLLRLLRLGPALLVLLTAYVLVAPWLWPQFDLLSHLRDAALAGFYLSDYSQAFWQMPNVLVHTWSLSVEAHFYLVWPFAVLLLVRMAPRWRMAGLFGIYFLAGAWRISEYESMGLNATYYRFDTRISGMVCGALLAMWLQHRGPISERVANVLGVFAASALALCLSIGLWGAPWSLMYLTSLAEAAGIALLIAGTTERSWVNSILGAQPLVRIGMISYGVYLWHYPAAFYFRTVLPWYLTAPIVLSFSIAMAAASYFFIEGPLQTYRRSLRENRRAAHNKAVSAHGAAKTQSVAAAT